MIENADIRPTLQSIPWLMDLSPEQIKELEKISGFRFLSKGEILFNEGDDDNLLYIVSEGSLGVDIYIPGEGQVRIYNAEPLDLVGWDRMTPVTRRRITTITALQKCYLIYFNGAALNELCNKDKELGYLFTKRMSNVIASRLLSMRNKFTDLLLQK